MTRVQGYLISLQGLEGEQEMTWLNKLKTLILSLFSLTARRQQEKA
jgi:hypothetical protein